MLFGKASPMAACLWIIALGASTAQTSPSPAAFAHSFAATAGVSISQHEDASTSPIPFTGMGLESRVSYEHRASRWITTITVEGSRREYSSRADAGTSVRERSTEGAFTASLVRRLGTDSSWALSAGLAADARGGVLMHRYADPAATTSDYVNAFVVVGPAVDIHHALLGGLAALRLNAPAFGVAHHPYSDTRIERASPNLRIVSPALLHGFDATATFGSSETRRVGVFTELHARAVDYTDVQRLRGATSSISIGLVSRFGRLP